MVHDSYPARMDIDYPEKLRKDVPEHPYSVGSRNRRSIEGHPVARTRTRCQREGLTGEPDHVPLRRRPIHHRERTEHREHPDVA